MKAISGHNDEIYRLGSNQTSYLSKKLSPKKEPVQEAKQASNDLQSILGFVMPTEHVSLPSQGKFYPPEHPLHNCEDIEIKFLTAKELDIDTDNISNGSLAIVKNMSIRMDLEVTYP